MDWSLTRPEQGNVVGQSDDFIEEQVKRNVAFAKLEDLIAWGARIPYGLLILASLAVM